MKTAPTFPAHMPSLSSNTNNPALNPNPIMQETPTMIPLVVRHDGYTGPMVITASPNWLTGPVIVTRGATDFTAVDVEVIVPVSALVEDNPHELTLVE